MLNRTKIALLSAVSNLIFWLILTFVWHHPRTASLEGEALARTWGTYFLGLVAGFLVLNTLSAILVMTKEKRAGGQGFEEKTDERDRYIEGFAMKAFALTFSLCFFVSVVLLALGLGLQTFFYALSAMLLLADLAMWTTYIVGYERGL